MTGSPNLRHNEKRPAEEQPLGAIEHLHHDSTMKSQRHFPAACGYVVVPTKLIDTAPSAAAILVYQVIQRMCLEAEGECKSPIKLIARDARVGVKPTKLSLYWLEDQGWIQVNRTEGCAYSYLAFTRQVNQ